MFEKAAIKIYDINFADVITLSTDIPIEGGDDWGDFTEDTGE